MKICSFRVSECVIFIIFVFVPQCVPQGRRYDIEEESQKLYNADLKTVIARFRRSPEYLKILRMKVNEMFQELEIKETYLFLSQKQVIEKRVKDTLSMTNSTASVDCITVLPRTLNGQPVQGNDAENRKALDLENPEGVLPEEEVTAEDVPPAGRRRGYGDYQDNRRRQKTTKSGYGVSLLDNYSKFSDKIQVAERNKLRDIGYEEAGNLIHKIISAMDDDLGDATGELVAGEEEAGEKVDAREGGIALDEETHERVHTVTTEALQTLLPAEKTPMPESVTAADGNRAKNTNGDFLEATKAEGRALSGTPKGVNVVMPPKNPKAPRWDPNKAKTRKGIETTTTKKGIKATTTKKVQITTTKKATTTKPTTNKKWQITTTTKATTNKATTKNKVKREFTFKNFKMYKKPDFFEYLPK